MQLRLQQYPYTYLRTTMMKKALLKKEDYDRLAKLSASEISAYLQDLEYKQQIDELGVMYSGAELVERALEKNLSKTFAKLIRISPLELKKLIRAYLIRYEYENAKIILRGRLSKLDETEIKRALTTLDVDSHTHTEQLLNATSMSDTISSLFMIGEKEKKLALDAYDSTHSVAVAENLIDRAYFTYVLSVVGGMLNEGRLFKKFLLLEIDAFMLKMIFSLKAEGVQESVLRELILKGSLPLSFYETLTRSKYEDLPKQLEGTPFSFLSNLEDGFSLMGLDRAIDHYLVSQASALIKQHPMSVDNIVGYALLKQREITNLTRMVKSKSLGLSDEFLGSVVVV